MSSDAPRLPLRRFTVSEIHRLRETGVLVARTELLDGMLVDIPRPSAQKQEIIDRLASFFAEHLQAEVMPRRPIHPEAYARFDPTIMVHEWEQLTFTEGYRLHRFSVEEYHRMAELGLVDIERNELLDGVVLNTGSRRDRERAARLAAVLRPRLPNVELREMELVRLGPYSLIRPDLVLCNQDRAGGPQPPVGPEVRLAIDVSDDVDVVRQVHWPVYARWDIEQAWLVDTAATTILVAHARTAGSYGAVELRRGGDTLAIPTVGHHLAVAEVVRALHRIG